MSTRWINIVLILWLFVLRNYTMGQALYHQRYPEACRDAMEFYSEFEAELNHSASASNLEPAFLFGIVAPEVSQYNQINDYARMMSSLGSGIGLNIWRKSSFVRVNNVSLAYTVPKAKLDKLKFSGLKFYFNIQNALVVTPWEFFDPENKSFTPSYGTFGINLTL